MGHKLTLSFLTQFSNGHSFQLQQLKLFTISHRHNIIVVLVMLRHTSLLVFAGIIALIFDCTLSCLATWQMNMTKPLSMSQSNNKM